MISITALDLRAVACMQEVRRINMNAQGDDHVSFSAAHLALQGKYLLVSTDGPRIIMYNITGGPSTCLGHDSHETVQLSLAGIFDDHHTQGHARSGCNVWQDIRCLSWLRSAVRVWQTGSRSGTSLACQWRSFTSRWRSGTHLDTTSLQQPLTALRMSSMSAAQR